MRIGMQLALGLLLLGPALSLPDAVPAPSRGPARPMPQPQRVQEAVKPAARTPVPEIAQEPAQQDTGRVIRTQVGEASYYADRFHLRRTASGEPYDRNALVAAHRSYPFGTIVRVTNLANDRRVTVRIIDRGPFTRGRIIDLSRRAAQELGFLRDGLTRVRVEVLDLPGRRDGTS